MKSVISKDVSIENTKANLGNSDKQLIQLYKNELLYKIDNNPWNYSDQKLKVDFIKLYKSALFRYRMVHYGGIALAFFFYLTVILLIFKSIDYHLKFWIESLISVFGLATMIFSIMFATYLRQALHPTILKLLAYHDIIRERLS